MASWLGRAFVSMLPRLARGVEDAAPSVEHAVAPWLKRVVGMAAVPATHFSYDMFAPGGDREYGWKNAALDLGLGAVAPSAGAALGRSGASAATRGAGWFLPGKAASAVGRSMPAFGYGLGSVGTGALAGYYGSHYKPDEKKGEGRGKYAADVAAPVGGVAPSADPYEAALAQMMGLARTPSMSDKLVNQYLAATGSVYDNAIGSVHDDAADAMRRNNQMAANLGRDLAVGARTSRASAKQRKADNARHLEAQIGTQAAADAALASELGVDPAVIAGSSDVAKARTKSDYSGYDERAMLMGEADAAFADEAASWAKADAAEQNRQLQRQEQKQVGSLDAQKAAAIAQNQFDVFKLQQAAQQQSVQNQLSVMNQWGDYQAAKMRALAQADPQEHLIDYLKLLISANGNANIDEKQRNVINGYIIPRLGQL